MICVSITCDFCGVERSPNDMWPAADKFTVRDYGIWVALYAPDDNLTDVCHECHGELDAALVALYRRKRAVA